MMARPLKSLLSLLAAWTLVAAPAVAPKVNPDIPPPGASAELLEPASGRGRAVGEMLESRSDFQATRFGDGRVLVTGGSPKGPSTEWFDPASRRFVPGPPMTRNRQGHKALLLRDGRILLVGGTEAPAPAEVLDKTTRRFEVLPGDAAFALSAEAVELEDGHVLLVDGLTGRCWIWDLGKGMHSTGTLARSRNFFRATRLKDGKVAVTGGWSVDRPRPVRSRTRRNGPQADPSAPMPVEVFNPFWGSWSAWKAAALPRARHGATLLADGTLCLWGGFGMDGNDMAMTLEILDPARETIRQAGTLPRGASAFPAWVPQGLFLDEKATDVKALSDPSALGGGNAARCVGHLANPYLNPILVPLDGGSVLVMGIPAWGVPMERWDARNHQCHDLGNLRSGTRTLGLLPDGSLLALGAVVDLVDPRTGDLKPLGWREDLDRFLKGVKPFRVPTPWPSLPKGAIPRSDYAAVPLDRTRTLFLGGTDGKAGLGVVELWESRRKSLQALPPLFTPRAFPAGDDSPRGALKLKDGSVLVWGPGTP
jgi:hypothetical protein